MYLAFSPVAEACLCIYPTAVSLPGCIFWQQNEWWGDWWIQLMFVFRNLHRNHLFFCFSAFVLRILVTFIFALSCVPHILSFLLFINHSQIQMDTSYSQKRENKADFSVVHCKLNLFSSFLPPPHPPLFTFLSASSPVPDGDDAFSASCQYWPSACGLVPVHLLWLLCQPSTARLPVQLPACHWRVSCTHLWWVHLHRRLYYLCFDYVFLLCISLFTILHPNQLNVTFTR